MICLCYARTQQQGKEIAFCCLTDFFAGGLAMKVGFFQFDPQFGEVKANVDHAIEKLQGVKADLIVLPELFNTGYQFISKMEVEHLSEEVPHGFTTQALIDFCQKKDSYIAAGLAEKAGDSCFNSAILVGPEGLIGLYRKTHLFAEEKVFFTTGDTGFKVFDIGKAKIGLMICFDWFFPESVRSLALNGAELICHCANLVLPYCPDAMVTRCLENHVFAITANRVGYEERGGKKRLTYIGESEVVAPAGKVLFRADKKREQIAVLDIDPLLSRNKQVNEFNNIFSDRRPKLYVC